ncbi:MAG: response regulator [Chloroflexi bacterium SZAS-1]|nr:response regulator [Chloroflexi bacterium SZAS-1]
MQLSLIQKLVLGALVYTIMLVLVAISAFHEVTTFGDSIATAVAAKTEREHFANQFNTQLSCVLSAAQQYALFHNTDDLRSANAALTMMEDANAQLVQSENNAQLAIELADEPAQIRSFQQQRSTLIMQSQQLITALAAQPNIIPDRQQVQALQHALDTLTDETNRAHQNTGTTLITGIGRIANTGIWTIAASVIILLVTLGVLLVRLQRIIITPIKQMALAARAVGTGDLQQEIQATRTDEIGELQRSFNTMTANLRAHRDAFKQRAQAEQARIAAEEANKAKSAFLANMSHELRTPLSSIIGYSELLQSIATEPGQVELLPDIQKIQQAGRHLLTLINDVLDLSKIEAGKMYLAPEIVRVRALAQEVTTSIQPLMEKNSNHLTFHCAPDIDTMYTDPTKLRQVLLNLLSNAAKFTDHGEVALEITSTEDSITFIVSDTGIGMSLEQIKQLFQPFTQATAQTTRLYGGTGLGLTLSQHVCRLMGGDVQVSSELGKGTTCVVNLPLQHVPANASWSPTTTAGQRNLAPLADKQVHRMILHIDDDPATRDLVTRALAPELFTVVTAADGEMGLQLARDLLPDAIILDVLLPNIDGWTVLSALKSDPQLADIPVVMLTIVDDQATGFSLGATDYLVKPVELDRLSTLLLKYDVSIAPATHQATKQVLIVEDDDSTRELLCRTIQSSGYTIAQASTGIQACDHLQAGHQDLYIVDLTLPDMDGVQVIEAIRSTPAHRTAPIIVLTAKDLSASEREQLSGSVNRIIAKGMYRSEELLAEVQQLLTLDLEPAQT